MSHQTFFFYDLETSGVDARNARIMQFAGIRTDMDLEPLGEPYNILIKLSDDILPDPDAILVTGITPQNTIQDGITEAEFIDIFDKDINIPGTIFVGFNSVRFDDEFMRFLMFRNFYDSYAWLWKDGRSRWDLLDVVRMTRALRPEGINWPFSLDGKPTNRLEMLTELNNLLHEDAHDALSDVRATIAVANLIKTRQPKLFDFLLMMRDKKIIQKLVESGDPFVYVSGKYNADYEKLAVVSRLGAHPDKNSSLVYDLRYDPTPYIAMTPAELVEVWKYKKDSKDARLPVKTLRYNRCPAIAPLSVLNVENIQRLKIDMTEHKKHQKLIEDSSGFYDRILEALAIMDKMRGEQTTFVSDLSNVDSKLYDGFIGDQDRNLCAKLRSSSPKLIGGLGFAFKDDRLNALLPLYKARNYPKFLNNDEREKWESFRINRLNAQLERFASRLEELSDDQNLDSKKKYLLDELKLYAQSLLD